MLKKYKPGLFPAATLAVILAGAFVTGVAQAAKGLDLNLNDSGGFSLNRNSAVDWMIQKLTRSDAGTEVRPRTSRLRVDAPDSRNPAIAWRDDDSRPSGKLKLSTHLGSFSLDVLARKDVGVVVWPRTSYAMHVAQNSWMPESSWSYVSSGATEGFLPPENLKLPGNFSSLPPDRLAVSKTGKLVMLGTPVISGGRGSLPYLGSGPWLSGDSWKVWSSQPIGYSWVPNVAPIPEPETYAMLLTGLSLIGFMARRRKDSGS